MKCGWNSLLSPSHSSLRWILTTVVLNRMWSLISLSSIAISRVIGSTALTSSTRQTNYTGTLILFTTRPFRSPACALLLTPPDLSFAALPIAVPPRCIGLAICNNTFNFLAHPWSLVHKVGVTFNIN